MNHSKITNLQRSVAASLVVALLAMYTPHASAQQDSAQQQPAVQQPAPAQSNPSDTPNAPAPAQPASQQSTTQQPASQQPAVVPGLETRPSTSTQDLQDNPNAHPVGAAAAPVTRPTGIPASRPAGAAIAPAKQRRVKAIVIRVAIIVGAAAAVGAVAGLSKSSSSRP